MQSWTIYFIIAHQNTKSFNEQCIQILSLKCADVFQNSLETLSAYTQL